jgi:uncharacterized protein with HEPN domain
MEAIGNIEQKTAGNKDGFLKDALVQVWVVHHIEIIGEAAAGTSREFREKYSGVPWADIIGMRNVLVHQYFSVDLEQVWATLCNDLPKLKSQMEEILRKI